MTLKSFYISVFILCSFSFRLTAQNELPNVNKCELLVSKKGTLKEKFSTRNEYYWCLVIGSPNTLLYDAMRLKEQVKKSLLLKPKSTDEKKIFYYYSTMIAKTNLAYFYEMRAFKILQKTSSDRNLLNTIPQKKQKSLTNRDAVLKIIYSSLQKEESKKPSIKTEREKYEAFWSNEIDRNFKLFSTGKRQNPEKVFLKNEVFVNNVLTAAYFKKDFTTFLEDPAIVNYIAECDKPIKHKGWDITRLDSKKYIYRLSPELYDLSKKIKSYRYRDTKVIFNAIGQDRYNFIFQYGYAESYRAAYRTYQLYVDGQKVFEGKWKNEKDKDTPPSFGLDVVKKLRKGKVGEIKVIENLVESKMYGSVKFSLDGFIKAEQLGKIPCQN